MMAPGKLFPPIGFKFQMDRMYGRQWQKPGIHLTSEPIIWFIKGLKSNCFYETSIIGRVIQPISMSSISMPSMSSDLSLNVSAELSASKTLSSKPMTSAAPDSISVSQSLSISHIIGSP